MPAEPCLYPDTRNRTGASEFQLQNRLRFGYHRRRTMKANYGLLAAALWIAFASLALAADNDNHQVTVTVNDINELAVTGGDITLTISAATAGQNPNQATNNTCGLQWTVNTTNKKITVATNQATFAHTLRVQAASVTGGTSAGEVTVSNTAQDLVTGIATTLGNCTLNYRATATAAQGTQSVVHTITYTITAAS
jgi:hypothetical protein